MSRSSNKNQNVHRLPGSSSCEASTFGDSRQSLNETRQRLIRLIAEHQLTKPGKKLQIGVLSEKCGISRQAFNRYYDDLKPYASGLRPVAELLVGVDDSDATELLNRSHSTVVELNKQLEVQKRQFEAEAAKIKMTYITSLMNGDLTAFNSNEIRQTLERTLIHSEQLTRQIDNLKLDLIKEQHRARTAPTVHVPGSVKKTIIDPDLSRVFDEYIKTGDEDRFDADKQREVDVALSQVERLCRAAATVVVIYAERYLSNFQKFAESYMPSPSKLQDMPHVILRLPTFNRGLLATDVSKFKAESVQVFVPDCIDLAIRKSQRFRFRNVPSDELQAADKAHSIPLSDAIHSVCTFIVNEGD